MQPLKNNFTHSLSTIEVTAASMIHYNRETRIYNELFTQIKFSSALSSAFLCESQNFLDKMKPENSIHILQIFPTHIQILRNLIIQIGYPRGPAETGYP